MIRHMVVDCDRRGACMPAVRIDENATATSTGQEETAATASIPFFAAATAISHERPALHVVDGQPDDDGGGVACLFNTRRPETTLQSGADASAAGASTANSVISRCVVYQLLTRSRQRRRCFVAMVIHRV